MMSLENIEKLNTEQLRALCKELYARNEELEAKYDQTFEELLDVSKNYEKCGNKLSWAEARILELDNALTDLTIRYQLIENEMINYKTLHEALTVVNNNNIAQLQSLSSRIKSLAEINSENLKELAAQKIQLFDLKNQVELYEASLDDFIIGDHEGNAKKLTEINKKLTQENGKLNAKLEVLNRKVEDELIKKAMQLAHPH